MQAEEQELAVEKFAADPTHTANNLEEVPPCVLPPCSPSLPYPKEEWQKGDVIFVRGTYWTSKQIMRVIGSDTSHTAIISDANDDVTGDNRMIGLHLKITEAQMHQGNRAIWLWNSVLYHNSIRVYRPCCFGGECACPNQKANLNEMLTWLETQIGTGYNHQGLSNKRNMVYGLLAHRPYAFFTGHSHLSRAPLTEDKRRAIENGTMEYICSSLVAEALHQGNALSPEYDGINITMLTPRQLEDNIFEGNGGWGRSAAKIFTMEDSQQIPWHATGDQALTWKVTYEGGVKCMSEDDARGIAKQVMIAEQGVDAVKFSVGKPGLQLGSVVKAHHAFLLLPDVPDTVENIPAWWMLENGAVKESVDERLLQYNLIILEVDKIVSGNDDAEGCALGQSPYIVVYGENIKKPLLTVMDVPAGQRTEADQE
jgi:hypothetical protein